ncbi:MAG: ABC transporter substrate-binding protein [Granulosicoccus sp.]
METEKLLAACFIKAVNAVARQVRLQGLFSGRSQYDRMHGLVICGLIALAGLNPVIGFAQDPMDVDVLYIEQRIERPPVLSNLVSWPDDEGFQGASLGIEDNNTTGKFLGQNYRLETLIFEADQNPQEALEKIRQLLAGYARLVVLNLPASLLIDVADLDDAKDDLLFNVQATDNVLRQTDCRSNVLHTIPSRAMLTDALGQFFTFRKWRQVFLVEGNRQGDKALAESMRESFRKFGLEVVEDKTWVEDADMRRTASTEVPVFTQARSYDVVAVADEDRDFSQYILYNTWLPRPVAGSAGLTPIAWSAVIEQWGAAQLQSRFRKLAERDMTSRDYANWAAIRSIGEAVTRTKAVDAVTVRSYILSEEFELAGFKGASLSYRRWNGQLRQPVQLVHANAVVASAPIEGYLHPITELDTLGVDQPETQCDLFRL